MVYFPISDKSCEFELGYGLYHVYFVGGFSVGQLEQLDIHLFNSESNETITLHEISPKTREMIKGKRAVLCFDFQVNQSGSFKLSIQNPEIVSMNHNYKEFSSLLGSLFSSNPSPNIHIAIK